MEITNVKETKKWNKEQEEFSVILNDIAFIMQL